MNTKNVWEVERKLYEKVIKDDTKAHIMYYIRYSIARKKSEKIDSMNASVIVYKVLLLAPKQKALPIIRKLTSMSFRFK
jgi:hypothetical protein